MRLWKYTKGRPPDPKTSPKTATRVDAYFADPNDAGLEKQIEDKLAYQVEDPVHKFLSNFDDVKWAMSDIQRRQMTHYINLLFNRCMARRAATKHTQEITAYALQKFLQNEDALVTVAAHWNMNAILKGVRLPRLITPQDVAAAVKDQLAHSQTESARQQSFLDNVVAAMTGSLLARSNAAMVRGVWNIIRTTNNDPFVLSDTPVVTWERLGARLNYGVGFERQNVEVILPVSPLVCLQILPAVERTRPDTLPTVGEINIAQAAFAHTACFANQNKKEIDELVQRHIQTIQIGRNAFTLWHRNFDDLLYDILIQRPLQL